MIKKLRKAIMRRSGLKNIPNKSRTFLCKFLRKTKKKEYFENNTVKDINDNKKFWKTIKLFFSNKD